MLCARIFSNSMIKKVEKRDGTLEDYDPEKIKKVVLAAGLLEDKAKELVTAVNAWAMNYDKEVVDSILVRDRILIEIQKLDEYVAKEFSDYQRYKDKNFGIKY